MKAGLVPSVPEETIVVIRKSYLIICEGNACAAALLNYLEYCLVWKRQTKPQATIRNQMAIARGQQPTQDTDEWWYASFEEIAKELLSIWGRNIVIGAMGVLLDKEFITRRHNPVKGFDRTWQYHFEAENVRKAMEGHHLILNDASFNSGQCIVPDETMQNTNVNDASFTSGRAIPEITRDNTEITSRDNCAAVADASPTPGVSEKKTTRAPREPKPKKPEPQLSEEEQAVYDVWCSMPWCTVKPPLTDAIKKACAQLAPVHPTQEDFFSIINYMRKNDRNDFYKTKGIKLWDIPREYAGWKSTQEQNLPVASKPVTRYQPVDDGPELPFVGIRHETRKRVTR